MVHPALTSGRANRSVNGKGKTSATALIVISVVATIAIPPDGSAQLRESAAKLIARTVGNPDFRLKSFRGGTWLGNGDSYLDLEPSASGAGTDIVKYKTATGAREVLVAADRLIPAGEKKPLDVENYSMSPDGHKVLVFTNSRTVWRRNTRGDYWVLNLASGALRKLGADAPVSSLMFAKFSPDNGKVGYVRGNNIYVEDLANGKITQLTQDGSDTIINGTSDWVSEEEFDIRDGFAWSQDSRAIAFWQFNISGVKKYTLIYNLDGPRGEIVTEIPYPNLGPYPQTLEYPYPLAGTQNSAVRVGVVSASGGQVVWIETPGDPRNTYIPEMGWADSSHVLIQHMNRLQNRNEFLLADTATGNSRPVFVDEDRAWVDMNRDVAWISQGREFLVLSERDGWRHLYRVARDTGMLQLVTRGDFDVVSVDRVSPNEKWVYFIASPDNATQRYLYRTRLDGTASTEPLTPSAPGTHSYTISPNAEWAFHTYSSLNVPPVSDVIHLPDHHVERKTV
ncbi:MAG TPA: DPP IV N-terminal domain-containing protein, partial [Candidatus Dormibacteraeota bacterium]|nr:DPP IV N-terminal domain-containing protein [Candidatus Dormibacteraeota bacterium]